MISVLHLPAFGNLCKNFPEFITGLGQCVRILFALDHCQGIVVVYDTTSMRSFMQLSKWMNYVEVHATADVSIMILGSKSDLDSMREVSKEEGKKVA